MKDNVTRFVVLSRDPLVATDALASAVPYKTSIVFSLQEVRRPRGGYRLGGERGLGLQEADGAAEQAACVPAKLRTHPPGLLPPPALASPPSPRRAPACCSRR